MMNDMFGREYAFRLAKRQGNWQAGASTFPGAWLSGSLSPAE
jgi:hypothetical protein